MRRISFERRYVTFALFVTSELNNMFLNWRRDVKKGWILDHIWLAVDFACKYVTCQSMSPHYYYYYYWRRHYAIFFVDLTAHHRQFSQIFLLGHVYLRFILLSGSDFALLLLFHSIALFPWNWAWPRNISYFHLAFFGPMFLQIFQTTLIHTKDRYRWAKRWQMPHVKYTASDYLSFLAKIREFCSSRTSVNTQMCWVESWRNDVFMTFKYQRAMYEELIPVIPIRN